MMTNTTVSIRRMSTKTIIVVTTMRMTVVTSEKSVARIETMERGGSESDPKREDLTRRDE